MRNSKNCRICNHGERNSEGTMKEPAIFILLWAFPLRPKFARFWYIHFMELQNVLSLHFFFYYLFFIMYVYNLCTEVEKNNGFEIKVHMRTNSCFQALRSQFEYMYIYIHIYIYSYVLFLTEVCEWVMPVILCKLLLTTWWLVFGCVEFFLNLEETNLKWLDCF